VCVPGCGLTIPLISDEPLNIGESQLLEDELGELLHERPQPSPRHGWHELVVQTAPAETLPKQGVHPPLGGAGFEMIIEAESFSDGGEYTRVAV
jgi:hypothetical protein